MKFDEVNVFRQNKVKDEAVDAREGDAIFTMRGNHDYMYDDIPATNRKENSGLACAKKVKGKFFIRINNRGEIFDPLEPNHVNSAGRSQNNIPIWKYRNVSYSTFAHYAHYLKTRNQAYLTMTRRDMVV